MIALHTSVRKGASEAPTPAMRAAPPRSHDHATGATGVGSVVGAWRCRVQLHATGWCMVDDAWSPARFGALGPASVIMMSEIEQLDPRIQPSATCACAYRTTFGESQREHDRWPDRTRWRRVQASGLS